MLAVLTLEEASLRECMRDIWFRSEESTTWDTLTFNDVYDSPFSVEVLLVETHGKVVARVTGVFVSQAQGYEFDTSTAAQYGAFSLARGFFLLILWEGLTGLSWSRDLDHWSLAMRNPCSS